MFFLLSDFLQLCETSRIMRKNAIGPRLCEIASSHSVRCPGLSLEINLSTHENMTCSCKQSTDSMAVEEPSPFCRPRDSDNRLPRRNSCDLKSIWRSIFVLYCWKHLLISSTQSNVLSNNQTTVEFSPCLTTQIKKWHEIFLWGSNLKKLTSQIVKWLAVILSPGVLK